MIRSVRLVPLFAWLALAACARAAPETPRRTELDPAVARAIMAPLLADPELAGLEAGPDPVQLDAAIPPDDFAPETVAAARDEARKLVTGTRPQPPLRGGACRGCDALFVDERAAVLDAGCRARLTPSLAWSLRLPADWPVYPRSHLREAAGSDAPGCLARAASFIAPVAGDEVLAFYRAVAARAGFALEPLGPRAFVGRRGAQRIAVIVRPAEGGFAQFDLMTAG